MKVAFALIVAAVGAGLSGCGYYGYDGAPPLYVAPPPRRPMPPDYYAPPPVYQPAPPGHAPSPYEPPPPQAYPPSAYPPG
jgi:hypothetical protein